jgi:hypothetical protein
VSGDTYLRSILQKYAVNVSGAEAAGNAIYTVIQKWGNIYLLKAEFSGSLAKGTGINIGTDADIFISVSSSTPGSLADLYGTLFNAVSQAGYSAKKQNVSIGTTVNGYKIDLVPGRRQAQYGNDHSLYKNKAGSWTQTNINTHIDLVKGCNRIEEIKLAKIWRQLHNLEFPSFYLEMVVIDSLKHSKVGDLSNNFLKTLEFFRDNLASTRYVDPANTNNIISDDLNATEKAAISSQARSSRNQQTWGGIVW